MHTKRWDVAVLVTAGVALWGIAAFFLWRDLEVPLEAFLGVAAVGAAGLSMARLPERLRWAGPVALLACGLLGSGWFAATTSPVLIAPLAVTLVATVVGLARSSATDKAQRLVLWYALTVSVLATTGAVYFHVLAVRLMADEVSRRLVLSAVWLVFGLVTVVASLRRQESWGRDAGFAALAIAIGKIVIWDTTHLGGPLRIGLLLGAGALLLAGGLMVSRLPAVARKAEAS